MRVEIAFWFAKTQAIEEQNTRIRLLLYGNSGWIGIVYKVSDKWYEAGFEGFTHKNWNYPGINELIEDYLYYRDHPNAFYHKDYDSYEVLLDDNFLWLQT